MQKNRARETHGRVAATGGRAAQTHPGDSVKVRLVAAKGVKFGRDGRAVAFVNPPIKAIVRAPRRRKRRQKLKTIFAPMASAFGMVLLPAGLTRYCRLGCTSRPGRTEHP